MEKHYFCQRLLKCGIMEYLNIIVLLLMSLDIKWGKWLVTTLSARGLNWGITKLIKKMQKDPIKKAYEAAYKKWDAHFYVKEEHKDYSIDTFEKFSENVLSRSDIHTEQMEKLFQLFEEELVKSPETSGIMAELRGKAIEIGIEDILKDVKSLASTVESQSQLLSRVYNKLSQHNKGRRDFILPSGYIQRTCSPKINNTEYLRYILEYGSVKSYKLLDIVLGETECKGNKFILYGDAQSGKSYELEKLAFDLKKGSEYVPVMYEVKEHKDLENSLPALDNAHDTGMVLIIDALDEKFDGEERLGLYNTINGYAKAHPCLHIVLSCRSNFKGEFKLEGFTPLVLNNLTHEEACVYLKTRGLDNLINEIEYHNLYEFYKVPFYLIAISDYYEMHHKLPENRSELYDFFIDQKLEKEEKKNLKMYAFIRKKGRNTLKRIAVALQLMGESEISLDDISELETDCKDAIDRAMRSSLIQSADGKYSFVHNSFKEFFVAQYLLSRQDLGQIQKLCCYYNTTIVRNEWYNTVALLLSMLPRGNELTKEIMDWIVADNKELVLFVDSNMFEQEQRNAIFKDIINGCKEKNLRFGDFVTSQYEELMMFGFSDETLKFLIKELCGCKEIDNHLANILFCLRYLDMRLLSVKDNAMIKSLLFKTFAKFIVDSESSYVLFEVFRNPGLLNKDTVKRLYSIIKNEDHPDIARNFVSYVLDANCVEAFINEIISKSEFVHDYGGHGYTRVVSREPLLKAYQKVVKWPNIKKVMSQLGDDVKSHYYYDGSENRDYNETMSCLLKKAAVLAKTNSEVAGFVFNNLMEIAENRYSMRLSGKDCFVEFFEDTETIDHYFEHALWSLKQALMANNTNENFRQERDQIEATAYCTALLLNKDRLENMRNDLRNENLDDHNLLCWIKQYVSQDVYDEIVIIEKNCFTRFWRDPNKLSKLELRHQRDYDELMDYEKFKTRMLQIIENKTPQNRVDLKTLRNVKIDFGDEEYEGISQYAFKIFNENTNMENKVDLDKVRKSVCDEKACRRIMVETTMDILYNGRSKVVITDEQRKLFKTAAIEWLRELATGPYDCWYRYQNAAISALLHKEVSVDKETLLKLLPYSSCYIHLRNEGVFGRHYTVFERITEEFAGNKETFLDALRECMDNGWPCFEPNQKIWGVYLVKNMISSEYQRLAGWIRSMLDDDPVFSIIQAMAENPDTKQLLKSKEVLGGCDVIKRLFIYEQLAKDCSLDDFVRKGVEREFGNIRDDMKHQALRILLVKGSLVGLRYLAKHPERLHFSMAMHYQTLGALPLLMKIYSAKLDCNYRSDYLCILNAIEEIAMASEENWLAVKTEFEKKIKWRKKKYIQLNWYIENWEVKFMSKNTPVMDINEVKRLLQVG